MTTFAFRTEMEGDNARVPDLFAAIGIIDANEEIVSEDAIPDYKMGIYRFDSFLPLEEIRNKIASLVNNDPRFIDMHRCYQTLNEGNEPDEYWFKKDR